MEELIKQINQLIDTIANVSNENIKFEEIGVNNNFFEANEIKNRICNYLLNILQSSIQLSNNNYPIINHIYTQTNTYFTQLNSHITNIKNLVTGGIHTPEYPKHRQNYTATIKKLEETISIQMINIKNYIDIQQMNQISNIESLKERFRELSNYKEKFEKSEKEFDKIIQNMRTRITKEVVNEGITNFDKLEIQHKKYERNWFKVIVLSLIVLISTIICAALCFYPDSSNDMVKNFITKVLIISAPSILLKISLTKYNIERNLGIIYGHRSAVLNQYSSFENAIGDEIEMKQAKNEFRLEIMKYIFSDPQTGYIKDVKPGEVSINPIINLAEKLIK